MFWSVHFNVPVHHLPKVFTTYFPLVQDEIPPFISVSVLLQKETLHVNFNSGGCFQSGLEWAMLGEPQHSCSGACADVHSMTAATFLCSSTHCFCFLSRSVSPDLKSFAVGIETLGGRVLGKT